MKQERETYRQAELRYNLAFSFPLKGSSSGGPTAATPPNGGKQQSIFLNRIESHDSQSIYEHHIDYRSDAPDRLSVWKSDPKVSVAVLL